MVIWGGAVPSPGSGQTGGRYDPVGDTWAATSTEEAPQGRTLHSAFWTGNQMIVWGGSAEGGPLLNTGGRYDPVDDSWTATNSVQAPAPRYSHAAVWTGAQMIVQGGTDGTLNLGDLGSYCACPVGVIFQDGFESGNTWAWSASS
jgi:hypothetical protein